MEEQQNQRLAFLTVLAIFIMGQCPGSIDAAISKIAAHFSLTSTTALYVTTVASLTSVVSGIVVGLLAGRRIPFRTMVLCCAGVEILGSLLPFFVDNFVVILFFRALFGLGIGGMMCLENSVASLIIPTEKRAQALGIGMFCGFGVNCLLQFTGGLLADVGWNYVFLIHLMLLIPFGFLLLGCPPMTAKDKRETTRAGRISPTVLGLSLVMAVVGLLISPLLIGCSFLSAAIVASTTVAGVVAVCFSVGCMLGGLFYSAFHRSCKRWCISAALTIVALGTAGSAVSSTVLLLCLFIFIAGIGFSLTQTSLMMTVGLITAPSAVALASSLLMSLFNLGMFCSSQFEALIGVVTGDALYMPLYIGVAVYLFLAVVFLFFDPPAKKAAEEPLKEVNES